MTYIQWYLLGVNAALVVVFSILDYVYKPYEDWDILKQKLWRTILILIPLLIISLSEEISLFTFLIYFMLLCALIGDLLIIKNLMAGLIAFLACHILNSINFFIHEPTFSSYSICIGLAVYAFGLYIFTMLFLGKIKGIMGILVPIYLLVILCSVWRSYVLFLDGNIAVAIFTSIGTTLFFFTDAQVANEALLNNLVLNNYKINHTLNNILYYGSLMSFTAATLV
ncbi:MAG: lysoplasmalogenase family protein [Candidatus Nanoarchaeia archaeon]|nr:lysoplasmalogenase family protein [Candidatus Nanoarchaeia archaeon]